MAVGLTNFMDNGLRGSPDLVAWHQVPPSAAQPELLEVWDMVADDLVKDDQRL